MTNNVFKQIAVFFCLTLGSWPNVLQAQKDSDSPYRIAPPLRVAQRSGQGVASVGTGESDPYLPRDPRKEPKTVAVHGFCLVTLRDRGQWVLGVKQVRAIREGKIYLFATPRERDIFIAGPERYLPVLDGDCVVTFAETGERAPGSLEWGLLHRQRLYFFASQQKLEKFQENPNSYTDVDLVDGGRCIVSKVEEHRNVAGLPESVAVVDGRRYFFASALHRKIFLSSPRRFGVEARTDSEAIADAGAYGNTDVANARAPGFGQVRSSQDADDAPASFNKKLMGSAKKAKTKDAADTAEKVENRAMSGYCPVTIRTLGLWQRGKSNYKKTYDGKVYFMAGPEELAAFKANPQEYTPVLSGDSVVTYANDFTRAQGSVFHAAQYKNRLYLFANANESKIFSENKSLYENADLAYQGNCMVSKAEEKQEVAGLPEFETIYLGKRYRFVSEDYLKKFLVDAKAYVEE